MTGRGNGGMENIKQRNIAGSSFADGRVSEPDRTDVIFLAYTDVSALRGEGERLAESILSNCSVRLTLHAGGNGHDA